MHEADSKSMPCRLQALTRTQTSVVQVHTAQRISCQADPAYSKATLPHGPACQAASGQNHLLSGPPLHSQRQPLQLSTTMDKTQPDWLCVRMPPYLMLLNPMHFCGCSTRCPAIRVTQKLKRRLPHGAISLADAGSETCRARACCPLCMPWLQVRKHLLRVLSKPT